MRNFFIGLGIGLLCIWTFGVGGFIATAIGAGLCLGGFQFVKRSWVNLSPGESRKRPLTYTIVFVVICVSIWNSSDGRGFVDEILTGFGGTALFLGGYLVYRHFGKQKSRGSK